MRVQISFGLIFLVTALSGVAALADPPPETPVREDGLISGYWFASPETRAIQDDDFSNPGLLYVDRGALRWSAADGAAGKSCASCHDDGADTMVGVGVSYPKIDEASGDPVVFALGGTK